MSVPKRVPHPVHACPSSPRGARRRLGLKLCWPHQPHLSQTAPGEKLLLPPTGTEKERVALEAHAVPLCDTSPPTLDRESVCVWVLKHPVT